MATRLKKMQIREISLVPRGANRGATVLIAKADDGPSRRDMLMAKCDTMAGNQKDVCIAEAKANEKRAKADLGSSGR